MVAHLQRCRFLFLSPTNQGLLGYRLLLQIPFSETEGTTPPYLIGLNCSHSSCHVIVCLPTGLITILTISAHITIYLSVSCEPQTHDLHFHPVTSMCKNAHTCKCAFPTHKRSPSREHTRKEYDGGKGEQELLGKHTSL